MTACTCQLPSGDPRRPGYCENCGGSLGRELARVDLGALVHEIRGVHLRQEALEQTTASSNVDVTKRLSRVEDRLADLMRYVEPADHAEQWQTTEAIADWLDLSQEAVRDHASDWRAARIGDGPKARLRFRRSDVEAALRDDDGGAVPHQAKVPAQRSRPRRDDVPLLPIRRPA